MIIYYIIGSVAFILGCIGLIKKDKFCSILALLIFILLLLLAPGYFKGLPINSLIDGKIYTFNARIHIEDDQYVCLLLGDENNENILYYEISNLKLRVHPSYVFSKKFRIKHGTETDVKQNGFKQRVEVQKTYSMIPVE